MTVQEHREVDGRINGVWDSGFRFGITLGMVLGALVTVIAGALVVLVERS